MFTVPVTQVQAVAGDPVYMPCDISTTEPDDQVLLVLWYREDLGTPIYRYVINITTPRCTRRVQPTQTSVRLSKAHYQYCIPQGIHAQQLDISVQCFAE